MSTKPRTSVTLRRVLLADRETLFRAWTEPERMVCWMAPEGFGVADAEVDLVAGRDVGRLGETVVTVELKPAGEGATELLLTHERLPTEQEKENHRQGLDELPRPPRGASRSSASSLDARAGPFVSVISVEPSRDPCSRRADSGRFRSRERGPVPLRVRAISAGPARGDVGAGP